MGGQHAQKWRKEIHSENKALQARQDPLMWMPQGWALLKEPRQQCSRSYPRN